ncbi:cyclic nucleotide-binding protein [Adhaeribacter arboris]|uniref:Cyclic nucleotide-binding protein n=1 Tax=Adhaeribacter arboris TaxID=2072846 RepID=A0A2T2Y8S3_9BACT|nr:Crp/Fnr family transcriptional regulator [Adhaeribacter arboris]PSR51896.1 cyclic nucleotide-binding protein [Adhaeribacter arboris]
MESINTSLAEALNKISKLSSVVIEELNQLTKASGVKKNTILLDVGAVSRHLYFIQTGLARVFYFHEAEDVTDYFAIDNQFIGGVESLFTGMPSKKGIHVLEDSIIYSILYADLEELCRKYHEMERAGRMLAIYAFLEGQQRIESIRFHEAKERYKALGNKYPGILNRCPLKHIASYLGITQVSLSRLRAGSV